MIDLSRLPLPAVLEEVSHADLLTLFMSRFVEAWHAEMERDPSLPDYTVSMLETDPARIALRTLGGLRMLDRQRVNDAIKALLAAMARGADLDNVVARQGIARLVVVPATGEQPAVMETDAALLRRYLLSFDRPSAGSAGRYLYEAWTAAPSLSDARVNGRAIHGRVGDVDVVIAGTDGADPTPEQIEAVQAAVLRPNVKPEAVGVAVIPATRVEYRVEQRITVPVGPDAELVRAEAEARVRGVTLSRMQIGAAVPRDLIAGAAFGASVVSVVHVAPAASIVAEAYSIPACVEIDIAVEVLA